MRLLLLQKKKNQKEVEKNRNNVLEMGFLLYICRKQLTMKTLIFLSILLLTSLVSYSQTIPNTDIQFKSEIIKFSVVDSMWTRIDPINNVFDSILSNEGLDESIVMGNLLNTLNQLRKNFGSTEVSLNQQISDDLNSSLTYGTYLNGFTNISTGFFYEYNYVSLFDNREAAFCRYLLDCMCVDSDLFRELINSSSTEVGFYFTQNYDDLSYQFAIFVK